MVLSIPANHLQLAFVHTIAGSERPAVCTIGCEYDEAVTSSDVPDVVDYADAQWGTHILPVLTNNVTHVRTIARSQAGTVHEAAISRVGGQVESAMAPNTAYLVKKTTLTPGRGHSGRMYLPGVAEAKISGNGTIDVDWIDNVQIACNNFLQSANNFEGLVGWRLLHNLPTLPPGPDDAPDRITGLLVDQRIATQRRRLR